jgi:hypothetical protein
LIRLNPKYEVGRATNFDGRFQRLWLSHGIHELLIQGNEGINSVVLGFPHMIKVSRMASAGSLQKLDEPRMANLIEKSIPVFPSFIGSVPCVDCECHCNRCTNMFNPGSGENIELAQAEASGPKINVFSKRPIALIERH